MSEQSLFRRSTPYKSSHSDHIRAIKKISPAKAQFYRAFFVFKTEIRVSKTVDVFAGFLKLTRFELP